MPRTFGVAFYFPVILADVMKDSMSLYKPNLTVP